MRVFAPNAFQFRNVRYPQGWQEVDSITAQLLKNAGWVTIFDPPFNSPIILAQSGVPILLTGNTSQNTLAAVTVPGGLMGKNGRLRVFAFYAANNNANTKTANVKFGGGECI